MLCADYDYPPKPDKVRWWDDPDKRTCAFWGCAVVLMIVLAWLAGGCGAPCQVAYNFDGQRYYRVEDCGHGPVVTCDSANRLPQPECGADDAPVKDAP